MCLFPPYQEKAELSLWLLPICFHRKNTCTLSNIPILMTITKCGYFSSFSLKMDCEKLVQEKTEMQRHYVMVSKLCATRM